ncbi:MAG: hypothetical protein POELPBGB_02925 [Bacteroidia bacterium]|nr:hypothetical protein [Bacteroidia bacterium]
MSVFRKDNTALFVWGIIFIALIVITIRIPEWFEQLIAVGQDKLTFRTLLLFFVMSFFEPSTLLAILGPTILNLSYAQLRSKISTDKEQDGKRIGLKKILTDTDEQLRNWTTALMDNSTQIDILVLAAIAAVFQAISYPLSEMKDGNLDLNTITSTLLIDPLSLIFILASFLFFTTLYVTILSGQLSSPLSIHLYLNHVKNKDKDNNRFSNAPPRSSKISLYRLYLVLYTYVNLFWNKGYLRSKLNSDQTDDYNTNTVIIFLLVVGLFVIITSLRQRYWLTKELEDLEKENP